MKRQNTFLNLSQYDDIKHMFMPLEFRYIMNKNIVSKPKFDYNNDKSSFSNIAVIYPPTLDWDWMKQRPQQLMEQFAKNGFDVYYCNKSQLTDHDPIKVSDNLTVINDNKKFIKETVPYIKAQGKKILLWVSWSKLHIFLYQYNPDFIVYDYIDDFPSWAPFLDKIVREANAVVSTSKALKKHIDLSYPYKPSFLIPNGCDISHFQKSLSNPPPKPAEYLGHNGPIICYAGAWASWIDQNLIMRTAMSFPNALIAIIGVEFVPPLSKLIKNVRHIGYKPYETLPQYIYYSDVCIIPFKINGITIAANPVKMYEYLSSGKPVISTDLPEARNIPGVYTASDSASFIFWIKKILNKEIIPDSEGIKIWLRSQTWESRFQNVIEMLRKTWTDI